MIMVVRYSSTRYTRVCRTQTSPSDYATSLTLTHTTSTTTAAPASSRSTSCSSRSRSPSNSRSTRDRSLSCRVFISDAHRQRHGVLDQRQAGSWDSDPPVPGGVLGFVPQGHSVLGTDPSAKRDLGVLTPQCPTDSWDPYPRARASWGTDPPTSGGVVVSSTTRGSWNSDPSASGGDPRVRTPMVLGCGPASQGQGYVRDLRKSKCLGVGFLFQRHYTKVTIIAVNLKYIPGKFGPP